MGDLKRFKQNTSEENNTAFKTIEDHYKHLGELLSFWLTHPVDGLLVAERLNSKTGYRDSKAEACNQVRYICDFIHDFLHVGDAYTKHMPKSLETFLQKYGEGKKFFGAGKETIRNALVDTKKLFNKCWMAKINKDTVESEEKKTSEDNANELANDPYVEEEEPVTTMGNNDVTSVMPITNNPVQNQYVEMPPQTGMGTGVKIVILLFVVLLVCGALAGMYFYLDEEEDTRRDSVADLEAGLRARSHLNFAKQSRQAANRKYLSGKELEVAARKRSRRRTKRSASRSRGPERRSRRRTRRKRSRAERAPRVRIH